MVAAAGQHVPAWKRLGLTLKHAKDEPVALQSPVSSSPIVHQKKSKRSHEDTEVSHEIKKRKLGNGQDTSTPSKEKSSPRPSPEKLIPSSIKKSPSKPTDPRKSVKFSQDTKTEDGDTGMNAFRDWVAQQNALEIEAEERAAAERANTAPVAEPIKQHQPRQADTTAQESAASTRSDETQAKPKKLKSEKPKSEKPKSEKPKSKPANVSESAQKKVKVRTPKTGDRPVPEYVRYLEQHHNDRSNWKFNKSKQNDLLKNVWSIYRVPSELNDALVEYIDGLQGAARQRLQDSARSLIPEIVQFIRREIPDASADPMDTIEARRGALEAAEKGQDDERVQTLRQKQKEDERATRLLTALLGDAAASDMSASKATSAPEPETARSKKKKRKSRTVASDSDSSSDDSDSDGPASIKKSKPTTTTETTDDSSSSSESDSSSDSSDDSESDSDDDSDSSDSGSSGSDDSSDDSSASESDDGSSDSESD